MTTYWRWTDSHGLDGTIAHVRAHLSAMASPDDDPDHHAKDVVISRWDQNGNILITGVLDLEPVADYLLPGYDPESDVAANPLTVPSIQDQP